MLLIFICSFCFLLLQYLSKWFSNLSILFFTYQMNPSKAYICILFTLITLQQFCMCWRLHLVTLACQGIPQLLAYLHFHSNCHSSLKRPFTSLSLFIWSIPLEYRLSMHLLKTIQVLLILQDPLSNAMSMKLFFTAP